MSTTEIGYGYVRMFMTGDQFEVINNQIHDDARTSEPNIFIFTCENDEVRNVVGRVVEGFGELFEANGHTIYVPTVKEVAAAIEAMQLSQGGISFEYMDMGE